MSLLRPSDRTSQRLERRQRPLLLQRLLRRVGRSGGGHDVRSVQSERLRDHAKRGRVSPQMTARPSRVHVAAILISAMVLFPLGARSEVASTYGGHDGHCGSRTANGERLNCAAMTAAHRTLPFGTRVRVCHAGCVIVRINDRGPWVRGRHIDLSPAAARAIGLNQTGHVTMTVEM
jgi:rare lipoprotein A